MNRIAVAVVLLVLSLSIGIFSYFYIENSCKKIEADLAEIEIAVASDDSEKIKSLCRTANTFWDEAEHIFSVLVGLDNTHDITEDLKKMEYFAMLSDSKSVILYLEECRLTLQEIKNAEKISFSTVF